MTPKFDGNYGDGNPDSQTKIRNQEGKCVPQTSGRGHQPRHGSANPGRTTPVSEPSSESDSANPMDIPAPRLAAIPTRESVPAFMSGKGRGKQWSQCGDRTIHQARQAGLNELQHEEPFVRFFFVGARLFCQVLFFVLARRAGVFSLFVGQHVQ